MIETGIGCPYYEWRSLCEHLASDYRILLYHRQGYGKSPESIRPRDTTSIAVELHELLLSLEVNFPFTLLGHSYGGLCAQHFTRLFPHLVKHLILVDSTSKNFMTLYELGTPVLNSYIALEQMIEANKVHSTKTQAELTNEIPSDSVEEMKAFLTSPLLYQTVADEFSLWEHSSETMKKSGPFPDLPLTIIARDPEVSALPFIKHGIPAEETYRYEQRWHELQQELSRLSKKGEMVIAKGSDHEIHLDRPDQVIECLLKSKKSGAWT
ncbi:alpha/beta fold hydrolase [Rossellomorea sp. FS2]|uniref:alpha/beta fold hydrolase n=1 Tax=Rossellomorea sp. FS2 TaxID=3391447 RepID=UPI003A4E6653